MQGNNSSLVFVTCNIGGGVLRNSCKRNWLLRYGENGVNRLKVQGEGERLELNTRDLYAISLGYSELV
jgi:hypothetical protein